MFRLNSRPDRRSARQQDRTRRSRPSQSSFSPHHGRDQRHGIRHTESDACICVFRACLRSLVRIGQNRPWQPRKTRITRMSQMRGDREIAADNETQSLSVALLLNKMGVTE